MSELSVTLIAAASTAGGYFLQKLVDQFFGKRRNKADDRSAELDVAIKNLGYYQDMVDDLGKRLLDSQDRFEALEGRYRDLLSTHEDLDKQHRELMKTNQDLITQLERFKQLTK